MDQWLQQQQHVLMSFSWFVFANILFQGQNLAWWQMFSELFLPNTCFSYTTSNLTLTEDVCNKRTMIDSKTTPKQASCNGCFCTVLPFFKDIKK